MSDQCKHCEVLGNIDRCIRTDCFIHESWYSIKIQIDLDFVRNEIEKYKKNLLAEEEEHNAIQKELKEIKERIQAIRDSDCGAWLGINQKGFEKRTELMRLLDKLYEIGLTK